MSEVADNLGKMEYDNFPAIQKEIFDASQDVREQVNGLHLALRELGVRILYLKDALCVN